MTMPIDTLRWLFQRHDGGPAVMELQPNGNGNGQTTVPIPAEVADDIDRAFLSARIERIREELNAIEQVIRLREDYSTRHTARQDGG